MDPRYQQPDAAPEQQPVQAAQQPVAPTFAAPAPVAKPKKASWKDRLFHPNNTSKVIAISVIGAALVVAASSGIQTIQNGRVNAAEAEVVAKQVGQLSPNSTIATLLYSNARMAKRDAEYVRTRNLRQDNFIDLMNAVDEAALVPVENQPLVFGDARTWGDLTERRARLSKAEEQGMSPAAAAIHEKLKQPVQVDFKNRPLSEVVKILSDMTGILMHIDPAGLVTEGLTPDHPVNLSLGSTQMITLRSALNLLLGPHNLDYRVQDEVLLITSARSTPG